MRKFDFYARNYLLRIYGFVTRATGGRGARTRTDSVGTFAAKISR